MKSVNRFAAVALLSAVAEARGILRLPKATKAVELAFDGFTPKPTHPAVLDQLRIRRQVSDSDDQTVLVAPDATCGYISGDESAGYTCDSTATCIMYTSQSSHTGAVACCDFAGCNYRTSCVDYSGFYSSSACGDKCAENLNILKCTLSSAQYCNTISFDAFGGGIIDYYCNNVELSTPQVAYTAYNGASGNVRPFSETVLTANTQTDSNTDNPPPTVSATGSFTSTSSPTQTGGVSDNDDNGGGKKKTSIAPIIGGVVGGVAAIAIGALALFFFFRSKKKHQQQGQQQPPPNLQSPQMQQGGPTPPPGGYAAVPQDGKSYYGGNNNSQYATPATQYSTAYSGGYSNDGQRTHPESYYGGSTTASQYGDPRMSQFGTSPTPSYGGYAPPMAQQGFAPQQEVIHEAPAQRGDDHRGQMHELG